MPTVAIIQAFGVILAPWTPSKYAFRSLPETILSSDIRISEISGCPLCDIRIYQMEK
jgi:hypothetical protein